MLFQASIVQGKDTKWYSSMFFQKNMICSAYSGFEEISHTLEQNGKSHRTAEM